MLEKSYHYNNEICLFFDPGKHHYTVNGKTIDGVTTVLGVINKPALMYWAVNKAVEYIDQNLPVGVAVDEVMKKKIMNGCKAAHRTIKTDAADLGTMLHELVEKYIKKEKYEEPTNEILQASFAQFKQWEKDNNVEFLSSEKKIYSRKYNYCGTMDFMAIVNGIKVIGDLKTSSGIWDEYFLQVAAYG
jgi:cytochrome c2